MQALLLHIHFVVCCVSYVSSEQPCKCLVCVLFLLIRFGQQCGVSSNHGNAERQKSNDGTSASCLQQSCLLQNSVNIVGLVHLVSGWAYSSIQRKGGNPAGAADVFQALLCANEADKSINTFTLVLDKKWDILTCFHKLCLISVLV